MKQLNEMKKKSIYEDKTNDEIATIIADKILAIIKSHLGCENKNRLTNEVQATGGGSEI